METPWLRAIWKTINLQGCTKHPETEKPAGTAKSIFPLHIKNNFLALDSHCCHKTRRRQIVLHGKPPSQTHLPFQRRFGVDFHPSQEYPCTFLLSRAWFHPRQTWQLPDVAISRADLSLSRHWGLGFALSWSPARAEGGWSRSRLPSSMNGKRKKSEKSPITTECILTLLCAARVPSAFLWLTPLCLLQPDEEGAMISPISLTRKPRTSQLPQAYPHPGPASQWRSQDWNLGVSLQSSCCQLMRTSPPLLPARSSDNI